MALELTPTIKFWLNFAHPATMWVLLALSLYAAYLGLQVQRTRNAQGEENLQAINVNGIATFNAVANFNQPITMTSATAADRTIQTTNLQPKKKLKK